MHYFVWFKQNMMKDFDFDDIRPYNDKEVKSKILELIKDPVFD